MDTKMKVRTKYNSKNTKCKRKEIMRLIKVFNDGFTPDLNGILDLLIPYLYIVLTSIVLEYLDNGTVSWIKGCGFLVSFIDVRNRFRTVSDIMARTVFIRFKHGQGFELLCGDKKERKNIGTVSDLLDGCLHYRNHNRYHSDCFLCEEFKIWGKEYSQCNYCNNWEKTSDQSFTRILNSDRVWKKIGYFNCNRNIQIYRCKTCDNGQRY